MMSTRWLSFEKGRQETSTKFKYIKDDVERLLIDNDEIKNGWSEHFDKLFNEESEKTAIESDDSFDDTYRRFVRRI
jgi:hypothetical protein